MQNIIGKQELLDFERKIHDRYSEGEIPYLIHLSGGNEDQLISIFNQMNPEDFVFSTHRSHYHYLLKGAIEGKDMRGDLEAKIMDGRSMFVYNRKLNLYSSAIVASTPALAAGLAWSYKRAGSDKKVWCFVGDGAEDSGHFYEAANFVEGWDLPCTFIIEDNDKSVDTTKAERRGKFNPTWPHKCVQRYSYNPIYGHYGIGNVSVTYKKLPVIPPMPERQSSEIPVTPPLAQPMKFKDAVRESMEMMWRECRSPFIGYNLLHTYAYDALKNIPETEFQETPLAENFMTGFVLGVSLDDKKPVLFVERHDFLPICLDALLNQADKIADISCGEFSMPAVIRAVVGGKSPMYPGRTHTQNLTEGMRKLVRFPVFEPKNAREMLAAYEFAKTAKGPVMITELKELYNQEST